ncbi:unnamed protein product [Closterium sp. Naga37s-1]|nr:unnamed protein product [Closterium sp. Naga37s-1]
MQTAAAAARTAAVSRPLDAIIRRVLNLAARSPTAAHSAAAVPSSSLFSSSFSSSSAASPVSTPSAFSTSRALVFGCSGGAGGGACAVTRAGGRGRAAGACAGAGAGAVNLDIGGLRWLKTSAGRVRAVGAKAKVGAGAGAGAVHVDIGARARARQTQRMWTLVIGGGAVAGLAIFAMNSFQENLMFYITPTQVSWVYCYSSHAPSHLPHPSPLLTPSSHVPFRPLIPRPFSSPHPSPLPTSRIPRPFSSPCLSCPFSSSLSGSGKALEKFAENSSANRFRLGGLVKEGR